MSSPNISVISSDIVAYYALHLSEYHMNMHVHPQCEIMYVTHGTCNIKTPDATYTLHKHQFIYLDGNLPHMLEINKEVPCSILNLEFILGTNGSISLTELKKESPEFLAFLSDHEALFVGNDTADLGYALKDLIAHMKKETSSQSGIYLRRLLFHRVLLELADTCQKNKMSTGIIYLKNACNYIHAHLTEELRIPDIAASAGINKSYLHLLFSRYMNCTISDYINQSRLELAAFLLENSSLVVTDIAFQSGYNSRQHFSVTFEKYYGVSPRAYRQLHQKKLDPQTGRSQLQIKENGVWSAHPLKDL